jgi:hypothetical protein
MSPFKPDTDSFHRLLASVGILLVLAALIGPILVYREMGPLRVSERELRGLTPTASKILRDRQQHIGDVQNTLPWAVTAVALAGIVLLCSGARGMRTLSKLEHRTAAATTAEAEARLSPQSQEEQDQRIQEDIAASTTIPALPSPEPARPSSLSETIRQAREVEHEVLNRLKRRPSDLFHFRSHMALRDDRPALLIDGVFTALETGRPDVLVEVKYKTSTNSIRMVTDQCIALAARYEDRTNRRAVVWLIVVTDRDDRPQLQRLAQQNLGQHGTATVLHPDELEKLEVMRVPQIPH